MTKLVDEITELKEAAKESGAGNARLFEINAVTRELLKARSTTSIVASVSKLSRR